MNLKVLLIYLCVVVYKTAGDCPARNTDWDNEVRIAKLESLVNRLNGQVADLTASQVELEAGLKAAEQMVKCTIQQVMDSKPWTLKRTQIIFPNLEKLALEGVTPTYVETLPVPLPNNTRALIVQVYCLFNNQAGHAYLYGEIKQEGNEEGGGTKIENKHYAVYANSFYNEVMVPWDSSISNKIQLKVTSSHQTGGPDNWYRVRVVGYILA